MGRYRVGHVNKTLVYSRTGVRLGHFGFGSACEGGGDKKVAGKEDGKGNDHPLKTDEDDGVNLKSMSVSHFF